MTGLRGLSIGVTAGMTAMGGWWVAGGTPRVNQFQQPTVTTVASNAGNTVDRSLCLTVNVALRAAAQCGDLRVVHAFGTTRLRGEDYTPTLVYNSGVAELRPVVRAWVTKPAGAGALTQVSTSLEVAGAVRNNSSWTGSDITSWAAGTTRQFAVGFNAYKQTDFGSHSYPYKLTVRFHYGANVQSRVVEDTLLTVSRTGSYMGRGWWLAGYDRLYSNPPVGGRDQLMLVLGDGSARMYTQPLAGQPLWRINRATERPDSVYQLTLGDGNKYFFRSIPGGGYVRFNSDGYQDLVEDRFGQVTFFVHACGGRLSRIILPGGQREFRFNYAGCADLMSVEQVASNVTLRTDQITMNPTTKLLTQITDPSGTTSFSYVDAADADRSGLMIRRVDKRQTWTQFAYDSAGRFIRAATYMGATNTGDSIAFKFDPLWESQGFSGTASVDTASAFTKLDGPRKSNEVQDITTFWLAAFGNVRRVRNASLETTTATYADLLFAALVTRVVDPAGFIRDATYDDRGRMVTHIARAMLTNPIQDAVTSYQWTTPCDRVTRITPPVTTQWREFDYNSGTCTLAAERNGRGAASQVDYLYYSGGMQNGLLQRVTMPADQGGVRAQENYQYEGVGNLKSITSPVGIVTSIAQDSAGRDTSVAAPSLPGITRVRKTEFNSMGWPTREETRAGTDWSRVDKFYDGEGLVTRAATTVSPDINSLGVMERFYTYDRGMRLTTEQQSSPTGPLTIASLNVDLAGNIVNRLKVSSVNDTTVYDAMNRPTWNLARTKSQTSTFTYDAAGRLWQAWNDYARVTRTYNTNGLLATETQAVATTDLTAGNRWTAHVYTVRWSYDLMGRRTARGYPQQLLTPPTTSDSIRYTYDTQTGDLQTQFDRFNNSFVWTYDNLGRIVGSNASNTAAEAMVYDLNSRLIRRTRNAAGFVRDSLLYTDGGLVSQMLPGIDPMEGDKITYLAIGPVRQTQFNNSGADNFTVDPLGNRRQGNTVEPGGQASPLTRSLYTPQTGRLFKTHGISASPYPDTTFLFSSQDGTILSTDRVSYLYQPIVNPCAGVACIRFFFRKITDDFYAGAGRLDSVRVTEDSVWGPATTTPKPPNYRAYHEYTKYRYDALGRRVWSRTIKGSNCVAKHMAGFNCRSTLTRSIWDGAALAFEVRVPGGTNASATTLEYDGQATSPYYGRVGYVEGTGLDAPVALFKENLVVYPYTDWRGVYVNAKCFPGPCPTDLQFPAGQGSVGAWGPYGMDPDGAGWYGSLVWAQQDQTGRQYKRNRYYDVTAGQFTQEDPIGLAGGLNLYGCQRRSRQLLGSLWTLTNSRSLRDTGRCANLRSDRWGGGLACWTAHSARHPASRSSRGCSARATGPPPVRGRSQGSRP